jgi:hypothetical protein
MNDNNTSNRRAWPKLWSKYHQKEIGRCRRRIRAAKEILSDNDQMIQTMAKHIIVSRKFRKFHCGAITTFRRLVMVKYDPIHLR